MYVRYAQNSELHKVINYDLSLCLSLISLPSNGMSLGSSQALSVWLSLDYTVLVVRSISPLLQGQIWLNEFLLLNTCNHFVYCLGLVYFRPQISETSNSHILNLFWWSVLMVTGNLHHTQTIAISNELSEVVALSVFPFLYYVTRFPPILLSSFYAHNFLITWFF